MATQNIEVPEEITNNGWELYSKCKCNGILKYQFRNIEKKGMQVEWWVRHGFFTVQENGKAKIAVTKIIHLQETLIAL